MYIHIKKTKLTKCVQNATINEITQSGNAAERGRRAIPRPFRSIHLTIDSIAFDGVVDWNHTVAQVVSGGAQMESR